MEQKVDPYELKRLLKSLNAKKSMELASLAISTVETISPSSGYYSGDRLEKIKFWIKTEFKNTCYKAGEEGKNIINILNNDKTRGDIALASILLSKLPLIFGVPEIPLEKISALALLIIRYWEEKNK